MDFNLRTFLKETLLDMVGHKPDREIKYAASKWFDKGNLEETDLAEIEAKIEEQYAVVEEIFEATTEE